MGVVAKGVSGPDVPDGLTGPLLGVTGGWLMAFCPGCGWGGR